MNKELKENLPKTIAYYVSEVSPFVAQKMEAKAEPVPEVTILAIRAFNGIIAMCQEELSESDSEHLQSVLSFMCRIDVEAAPDELCHQIEGFISHHIEFLAPFKEGDDVCLAISENNLIKLIEMKHYGEKLRDVLKKLIQQQKKRRWYQFYVSKTKYKWVEDSLKDVEMTLASINRRIEYDSDKMIQKIVDNFYIIYIALLGLIKFAKSQQDITLELTINSQIDRILYIINPSFQAHELKNKYLLYYHVVYELKELYSSVLSDM
jgi:hypothetical protein